MNCQVVLEMLSPYLDGVLDPAEKTAVEEHISRCHSCRMELEELRACVDLLQELPEIAPPADFHAGLMEKINKLSVEAPTPQQKGWMNKVTGVTRKSWYRTAAVAAVMVMTLGITSLWEKEGNQMLPITPPSEGISQMEQQTAKDKQEPQEQTPSNVAGNNTSVDQPEKPEKPAQGTKVQAPQAVTKPVVVAQAGVRKFELENYQPQPSQGMVARSVILKLDVQDNDEALKAIGSITQRFGGSIVVPYQESSAKLVIKIPAQNARSAEGEFKMLGQVVTDMPAERDLSAQHSQAVTALEQIKAQHAELQQKYQETQDPELEKELTALSNAVQQQIDLLQQIERQSNYANLTLTLQ